MTDNNCWHIGIDQLRVRNTRFYQIQSAATQEVYQKIPELSVAFFSKYPCSSRRETQSKIWLLRAIISRSLSRSAQPSLPCE